MTVMLAGKNMSYTCLSKSTISVGCLESFSKFNKNKYYFSAATKNGNKNHSSTNNFLIHTVLLE